MRILVTGASGFAGSLLVPRLRADGHHVRALGRDPRRVRAALARAHTGRQPERERPDAADSVEIVRGDALSADGLAPALADVDVAYYLIHSMERPSAPGVPFPERERLAAEYFAAAAKRAGVLRIVYRGGLGPHGAGVERAGSDADVQV
ncbi:MAG: NAD-dependent epimerase/dehydratase, partial [Solirubrobacterales bacterium]|nr:NAD-dependent epimerase/dehydratase [Solirubrobacterales bacterium]